MPGPEQEKHLHILKRGDEDVAQGDDLGALLARELGGHDQEVPSTCIFVPQMFQQLQLPVGPLSQDGSAERLHDLLDGDTLAGELVLGRAVWWRGEAESVKVFKVDVRSPSPSSLSRSFYIALDGAVEGEI